jgi:hypothetical protein
VRQVLLCNPLPPFFIARMSYHHAYVALNRLPHRAFPHNLRLPHRPIPSMAVAAIRATRNASPRALPSMGHCYVRAMRSGASPTQPCLRPSTPPLTQGADRSTTASARFTATADSGFPHPRVDGARASLLQVRRPHQAPLPHRAPARRAISSSATPANS